jgi:hypothetical protein
MNHTIDTANGFKIEQRGVGHVWMHFMATREATGEGKSHTDLGTLKAWCNEQPPIKEAQPPVGSTLQEIAEKGFAGWMGFDSNGWAINTEAGKE